MLLLGSILATFCKVYNTLSVKFKGLLLFYAKIKYISR